MKELHRIFFEQEWEQKSFQSVAMLAWAAFLAANGDGNSSSRRPVVDNVFPEVESVSRVIKQAIEGQVFTTMVDVVFKYVPDRKHDPLLYHIYERNFELLFMVYSSKLMIDVPTIADQEALAVMESETDGEVASWNGDCLENIIEFATLLCSRDLAFARTFWRTDDMNESDTEDDSNDDGSAVERGSCNAFLMLCQDAAFKNPACFSSYFQLVAAAANGPDCAQLAFHHVKQNPSLLNWDHFFAVMAKYQRLLLEAEKPANAYATLGAGGAAAMDRNGAPGPRIIRPKELEALETIQLVIQSVIRDHQLALIFFHNHEWSPIPTFVAFLQSRIPSSLKGAIMKTLSLFARVPDIAPFVWRNIDSLQILRTTGDTSGYGNQDLSFELEHYESLSQTYPATRGFVTLLYELFENPLVWSSFEGDGRVSAIQFYFEFVLERVFLKFDLRKYEHEEEKWALVSGALSIFKKILRNSSNSASEGSLSYQLLARFLSGSSLLEKMLLILSGDGGVESLENTSTDIHLEHAFFYCLDFAKKQTEATHGSLNFVSDNNTKKSGAKFLMKSSIVGPMRERCVQHALEIVVLILEKDATFVKSELHRQMSHRLQVEMLHTILCRYRSDFVNIIQYIKYTKSAHIPHLTAVILRMISNRLSGTDLVDVLVDSGASTDIMLGYMNRLLNVYEDSNGNSISGEDVGNNESELRDETVSMQKKRKRQEINILSPYDIFPQESLSIPSIRGAILDLLLENLVKPAPNLGHLLLGVLNQPAAGQAGALVKSGLDAIITLISSPEFALESPELAERCYQVVYYLVSQAFTSGKVMSILESGQHDFFATQTQLFGSVFRVGRRRQASDVIAELNMRGWYFKTLAVYLHVGLNNEPPRMKQMNRLMSLLLSLDAEDSSKQSQMMLLQMLDECSFNVFPPHVPENQQIVALAEQATAPVERGYYKWLKIDVEQFCQSIYSMDLNSLAQPDYFMANSSKRFRSSQNGSSGSNVASGVDKYLQWAVQWNIYSERVAAESHALNSLRELVEIVVLDYLGLRSEQGVDTPSMWQGLDSVSSLEVRLELMSGIVSSLLAKLSDQVNGAAQLFEIAARMSLQLFSQLRHSHARNISIQESHQRQNVAFLELVFRAICSSASAAGNPLAARNARTLLYACVVNVLGVLPAEPQKTLESLAFGVAGKRLTFFTNQVIDLICRDSIDGDDSLSMALAISALEAIIAFDGSSSMIKTFRERGYLLHFIGMFRKICEMDATLSRGNNADAIVKNKLLVQGIDAATIGSMYECFLSLFARFANTQDGSVALVEGGLIRVIGEATNLPVHRPKLIIQSTEKAVSMASKDAFQRLEMVYYRKWLPLIRLLSGLSGSLPQNRTLASQVLYVLNKNRKLVTAALKINEPSQPSLSLLRERSYITFLLRYVTQFPDLCEKTFTSVKWGKISQAVLEVFMMYADELLPYNEDAMDDGDRAWWSETAPQSFIEEREDQNQRFACAQCEQAVLDCCIDGARPCAGLLRLSLFEEQKLYTSRMIVCNAAAFCAKWMTAVVDDSSADSKSLLLSLVQDKQNGSGVFPSMASSSSRSLATDSLWTHAPSLIEFTERFDQMIDILEASKRVVRGIEATSATVRQQRDHMNGYCDTEHVQHVVEYHADSMTFLVENMLMVLLLHFVHYFSRSEAAQKPVQESLSKVLFAVRGIEVCCCGYVLLLDRVHVPNVMCVC